MEFPYPDVQGPILAHLKELASVIKDLGADYSRRGKIYNGTVGEHVRHALDHVSAFVRGREAGVIQYDRRQRGTAVETEIKEALDQMEELSGDLPKIRGAMMGSMIRVLLILDPKDGEVELNSTLGREGAFVLSHVIHHMAVIAGILRDLGRSVPAGFGLAPSTVAAQEKPGRRKK